MTKVLYANGCSLTEGAEIGNEQFRYDEHTRIASNRSILLGLTPPAIDHATYMEQNAWPNKLKEKLGYDVSVNGALSGASNTRIARTTIRDVSKLLKTTKPEDIFVVINWTSLTRYELFYDKWLNVMPFNMRQVNGTPLELMCRQYHDLILGDLRYLMINHMLLVLSVKNFLENHGIKYAFGYGIIDKITTDYSPKEIEMASNDEEIQDLFELMEFGKNWILNYSGPIMPAKPTVHEFLTRIEGKDFYTFAKEKKSKFGKGNHPLENGHEYWATHLHLKLKNLP